MAPIVYTSLFSLLEDSTINFSVPRIDPHRSGHCEGEGEELQGVSKRHFGFGEERVRVRRNRLQVDEGVEARRLRRQAHPREDRRRCRSFGRKKGQTFCCLILLWEGCLLAVVGRMSSG